MAGALLLATPMISNVVVLAGVIGLGAGTRTALAVASGSNDLYEVRSVIAST